MREASFERALLFVLRWEGGYSNHPADKGGETNFGITHATYDSYRKGKKLPRRSVRLIERVEVSEIYHSNYWQPSSCELLPQTLALCHFDWAVNAGVTRAIKTLQQLVGTPDDGVIGPKTKQQITKSLTISSDSALFRAYCDKREVYYRRWATGSQRVFLAGWMNRLNALRAIT